MKRKIRGGILERVLSEHEKIRRAEEIYCRRNHKNISTRPSYTKEQKIKTYLGSKILLEMLVLVILAGTVFAVKNREFIFTQEFLNTLANYNVNITEKVSTITKLFEYEDVADEIFVSQEEEKKEEKIEENQELQPQEKVENVESIEPQAVTDVENLRNSYQFLKPIEGIVSSRFGSRQSQYQNVKGTHTGIDLATEQGTKIKAAMNGTVTQVSGEGDYGNHIKITQNNVTTLYAHCDQMYVAEGQEIEQGQEIASVGSTGNSTGPHLHFEVRIDDIPINPEDVMVF